MPRPPGHPGAALAPRAEAPTRRPGTTMSAGPRREATAPAARAATVTATATGAPAGTTTRIAHDTARLLDAAPSMTTRLPDVMTTRTAANTPRTRMRAAGPLMIVRLRAPTSPGKRLTRGTAVVIDHVTMTGLISTVSVAYHPIPPPPPTHMRCNTNAVMQMIARVSLSYL